MKFRLMTGLLSVFLCTAAVAVPPDVVITRDNPGTTARDFVTYTVTFDQPVGTSFDVHDVTVTGALSPAAVSAVVPLPGDPVYRVVVVLADEDANGVVGITIGTGVTNLGAEALAAPALGPDYTIKNFPNGDVNKDDTIDLVDVAVLSDYNLGLIALP